VEHEAKRGNFSRSPCFHHVFTMFSRCKMSAAPHELSSDNVPQLYCAILGSDDPFSDWWKLWQSKVLSDVGHLCKKAMPESEPGTTMPRTSISPDLNQCHSFQSIWSHLPLGNDAVSTPELFSYICFLLLGFTQRGKKTPTQNQVGKKNYPRARLRQCHRFHWAISTLKAPGQVWKHDFNHTIKYGDFHKWGIPNSWLVYNLL
jgi:hypothetical protein